MNRWPNFFIVGAPRSGTTTLYHDLKAHPNIYMPSVKEPHYFAQVDVTMGGENVIAAHQSGLMAYRAEVDYLRLFHKAEANSTIGEASAGYLYDESAPSRIREKNRNAKIIIVLRDPVERAQSSYLYSVNFGFERRGFFAAITRDYARTCKVVGQSSMYVEHGLYFQQVSRYLHTFGPENVNVYLQEDLSTDISGVIRDICEFIGVRHTSDR